jgi:dTDP-4-dehydrorhamnose 3,5-epimerase
MRACEITVEWLQGLEYKFQRHSVVPTIDGVLVRELKVNLDGRGDVTELWSNPWTAEGFLPIQHIYQSATDFGIIKCWHLHELHTDQFTVTRGKLQVALVDLREDTPTFGHVNCIFLGSLKPRLLKIPPMIMHGWKALSQPEVLVINLQTHVYAPEDEYKFPWNCVIPEIWEPRNG